MIEVIYYILSSHWLRISEKSGCAHSPLVFYLLDLYCKVMCKGFIKDICRRIDSYLHILFHYWHSSHTGLCKWCFKPIDLDCIITPSYCTVKQTKRAFRVVQIHIYSEVNASRESESHLR